MQKPSVSQQEIASFLKISQPSVNARIKRLQKNGLLSFLSGIDFEASGLILCRVDLTVSDPFKFLSFLKECTFFVNGFVMAGKQNLSVMLVTEKLSKMEEVIDTYIRSNKEVSNLTVTPIIKPAKKMVLQIKLLDRKERENCFKPHSCSICKILPKTKKQ